MNDIAVRVENMSKLYKIGARQERYRTLRDTLTEVVTAPFRRLRCVSGHQSSVTGHSSSVVRPRSSVVCNDTIWALKEVSFEVKRGEVIGIIGRNGAREDHTAQGLKPHHRAHRRPCRDPWKGKQPTGSGHWLYPGLTGRENIYLNGAILGMKRAEINHKFDEIVAFAEIEKFIDTPVKRHYPARYMLLVLAWNGDAGNLIPAVNHLETGRLQTMRREWNPRYYRLVEKFGEATGVPVLMNTSFNLRGEPIVGSPANAWNTFSKSGIDVLVLGRHVVRK